MAKDLEMLENICIEYYYMTDSYDRSLPHNINLRTGDSIIDPEYRALSNRYAFALHTRKNKLLHGFSAVEIQFMMATAASYSEERLAQLYESLPEYHLKGIEAGRLNWQESNV